jgi:hypothetical protein
MSLNVHNNVEDESENQRLLANCQSLGIKVYIQQNLLKVKSQGTEYIFHIGQVSALYKIAKTNLKIH